MMMTAEVKSEVNVEIVNDIPQDAVEYIAKLYSQKAFHRELERLGSGSYGSVYAFGDYAIKSMYDPNNTSNNDINVLKDISHLEAIPTLYAVIDNSVIIVDRVYGRTVEDYVYDNHDNSYNLTQDSIDRWSQALIDIVKLGYTPNDLHSENVMIDRDGNVKIVDVGFFKRYTDSIHSEHTNNDGYKTAQSWAGGKMRRYLEKMNMRNEVRTDRKDLWFMAV